MNDNDLLNKNSGGSSSANKVGALNQSRRGGANFNTSGEPLDFNAAHQAAKTEQQSTAEKIKDAAVAVATAPVSKATGNLLQQAWLNLIDSFGLTLIWINIHVFLGMVLGNKLFPKLGEEWVSSLPPALGGEGKVNKMTGLGEGMLLAGLDTLALALIFFFFVLVAMMLDVVDNPLKAVSVILGAIWTALFPGK